ncbi:type I restriction endonuclease [[Clostridium] innocuum]|uniref:type I restriction endonuclease n=1 Tax=Clostridium innocuum TaxID=1522 RepID=UPI000D6CCABB|nr:type I restriction endonuclease [[Clostridium] innocuum]PWJ09831.1 type I restriction enzyme R subunit [[Clostridium] innocuum]SSA49430.1 type I restriction enzyme, R subunit [[Clostridium] innocuum]
MSDDLRLERNFEQYISRKLKELSQDGWQISENDNGFNADTALCLEDFINYLTAITPQKIEKMQKELGSSWKVNLEKNLVRSLEVDGTIQTLRNGFVMAGYQTIECSGHYPDDVRIPNIAEKYDANILRIMHQVHYQTAGNKSLDLVFFINGIPVATAEVKTELTQTVYDAIEEFQTQRKPIEPGTRRKNPLLMYKRGAVVHFAVSESEIWMCTNLEPDVPRFLPFNKGTSDGHAGNDPMQKGDSDYPTGYFWNEICQKENWLRIFHDFIFESVSKKEDATGRLKEVRTQLFPRFHQWNCVTKCINDVKNHGVGKRYLIEHSAGSGKTETISWTAHELINLRKPDGEKIFSSVIVVTDRVGLDSNIKGTIKQLKKTPGLIEMIGGDEDTCSQGAKNKQLAKALHDRKEIIVVTLQTFPFALEEVATDDMLTGANFAVLIDEAHSSQTGQFAGKMKAALKLASKEKSKETGEPDVGVTDEEMILAFFKKEQGDRLWSDNVSFFAYTATPKPETKTLFGCDSEKIDEKTGRAIPESFDLYPMRQAIEEGYILDVLKGYMPYKTAYKLKDVVSDKLVDERSAMRTIAMWESLHPTNVMQKTQFIIEHFMKNVSMMLGGQAKAMIVASSRPAVIRYKYAIEAYLHAHPEYDRERLTDAIRFQVPGEPLVAFSGKVNGALAITDEDENTITEFEYLKENPFAAIRRDYDYTEENSNNIGWQKVDSAFDKPENRIMIVCDKFQTGFNQPKLCAMYIDKKLCNDIEIVQTYSRLNRIFSGKDHVFILDFVNEPETVERAFAKYDHGAKMEHAQRLEIVYDTKKRLDERDLYTQDEIDTYKTVRYKSIDTISASMKDTYRKKLFQAVSAPAERWNNAYKANHNAYATWTANKDEAERTGNKDLLVTANEQIEAITKEQEHLLDFKKDLKKYCSSYTYISQIVDLGEPELEIFYGFAKLLLKRLDGTPLEEIDISSLVLSDYRISELEHTREENDDPAVLRPMGGGSGTSKKKRASLKQIIEKLNEAFGENVAPVDGARTVNAIVDSVSADDVSRIQIRNSTNSREAIIADGRLENIIKVAALSLKNNELGQLATQILDDPQAIRPIAEMIYDLVNQKKHLDIEEISGYANNKE